MFQKLPQWKFQGYGLKSYSCSFFFVTIIKIVLLKFVFANMEKVTTERNRNEKKWWIFLGRFVGRRRDLNLTIAIGP